MLTVSPLSVASLDTVELLVTATTPPAPVVKSPNLPSNPRGPTTHSRLPSSGPGRGSPAPDGLSTSRCTAAALAQ